MDKQRIIRGARSGIILALLITEIACGSASRPYAAPSPALPWISRLAEAEPTPPETIEISEIVVEGVVIDAPPAYIEGGIVMVPVAAVAKSLGRKVEYDEASQTMTIGGDISLTVGVYEYTFDFTNSVTLRTAPALRDGVVFVPLAAFRDVLGMNNAYYFEGQVVIDNREKMR